MRQRRQTNSVLHSLATLRVDLRLIRRVETETFHLRSSLMPRTMQLSLGNYRKGAQETESLMTSQMS